MEEIGEVDFLESIENMEKLLNYLEVKYHNVCFKALRSHAERYD